MTATSFDFDEVRQKIIDVTKRQARAKTKVCIYEISKMDDLMSYEQAESIRGLFVKNQTHVRQVSNFRRIDKWTDVVGFIELMSVNFVDPALLDIQNEIVIFDNTVATYRLQPEPWYQEVTDMHYAQTMRSVFDVIWSVSESLVLGVGGSGYTKQYKPISIAAKIENRTVPVVVYPAKDDGNITQAFDRKRRGCIEDYVQECMSAHAHKLKDADMVIAYVWNDGTDRMCDLWSMQRNRLSDDSGFLYDAFTLRELDVVTDMGVSSGNSLIVFTAEEMLMRDLILEQGLGFVEASNRSKYTPKFPPGFTPDVRFYTN